MELRHLRSFEVLAEERHFGRAAARLRIAQPPLTRQIQALERDVGVELVDRSGRRIELTAAGLVFLQRARAVLEGADEAVKAARRASKGETGRVAVGYLSSMAYTGIAELLRAFRERAPDVEIVMRELGPQLQIEALRERRIDAGFTRPPIVEPGVMAESVRSEAIVVALPHDHPLAKKRRVSLASLAGEPFITIPRERGPAFFDQLIALCTGAGFSPKLAHEAPHFDLLSMVAAGFGVALVPESVKDVPPPGLVTRPLVEGPKTELVVTWREGDKSPALASFLAVTRSVGLAWKRSRRRRVRE
ncbi:MAG: LysR substrate-binding domain-containing protein [Polyangiaceae bacterium]